MKLACWKYMKNKKERGDMKNKNLVIGLLIVSVYISSCSSYGIEERTIVSTYSPFNPIITVNVITPTITIKEYTETMCQDIELPNDIQGMILYVKEEERYNTDIFMMDMNTEEEFRITDDPAIDDMPAISTDGKKIAFTSNRRGDLLFGLYVIDISKLAVDIPAETNNPPIELVMPGEYQIYWPTWSPIGNWIAYSARKGLNSYVEVINFESMAWWRVNSRLQWNHSAYWAPNVNRLYIINSNDRGIGDGSILQQVDLESIINNKQPEQILEEDGIAIHHKISINKNLDILFTQLLDEKMGVFILLPREGNKKEKMFGNESEEAYRATWSTDGNWISYITRIDEYRNINIYNIATKKNYKIFSTKNTMNINIVWAQDSKHLAFGNIIEGRAFIEVVNVDSLKKMEEGCEIIIKTYGPVSTGKLTLSAWIE
jgi:hypothetical protein